MTVERIEGPFSFLEQSFFLRQILLCKGFHCEYD